MCLASTPDPLQDLPQCWQANTLLLLSSPLPDDAGVAAVADLGFLAEAGVAAAGVLLTLLLAPPPGVDAKEGTWDGGKKT